jgi:hypothetical protein
MFIAIMLGVLPLGLLPQSGCFLRSNTVMERFLGEFRCPKDQIKIERPDKNQPDYYRATGCNRRAIYRCTGDYGEFCERIGQPETIHPETGAIETAPPNIGTPPVDKDGPSSAPAAP